VSEDYKPKVDPKKDVTKLDLNAEEGFVLSRIDGATSLKNLAQLTGMAPDKVGEIVDRLTQRGAVAPRTTAPAPALSDDDGGPTIADGPPIMTAAPAGRTHSDDVSEVDNLLDDLEDLLDSPTMDDAALPAAPRIEADDDDDDLFDDETEVESKRPEARPKDEEKDPEQAEAEEDEGEEEEEEGEGEGEGEDEDEEEEEEDPELTEGNYRKLYSEVYKEMDHDQRVAAAREEKGAKLCALCFDHDPAVIRSLLENLNFARKHARLVANHHRTSTGISHLAASVKFLNDGQVQRFLLRNPQTPEPVLKRMLSNKPLIILYKTTTSRELSDRSKRSARQAFRQRWTRAPSDEKVTIIFKTEGRCLNGLIGLPIDSKTAQQITSRTIHSVMLIQSFCRFPATPPMILQHLAKSAAVRRAPHIKKLILQHPNCPSTLKRSLK
jgi:hypothetical protein